MKDKLKNYSFWISVTGAVVLLLNNLGKVFGFSVNNEAIYSIVDGICGVLVVFGVLTMNKSKKTTDTTILNDSETNEQSQNTDELTCEQTNTQTTLNSLTNAENESITTAKQDSKDTITK